MRGEALRYPSLYYALAVVAGILIAGWKLPPGVSIPALTIAAVLLTAFSSIPLGMRTLIPVFAAASFLSMNAATAELEAADQIGKFVPVKGAELEGVVRGPMEYFSDGCRFRLAAERLNGRIVSGVLSVGVYNGMVPPLPGDRILLQNARVKPVIGFKNFGGFNKEEYLRESGITATVNVPKKGVVQIIRPAPAWRPDAASEKLRRSIHDFIKREFPKGEAASAAAMTIGVRGGLTPKEKRDYSTSGLAHLLAVAGLHVGFIGGFSFLVFDALFFWAFHFSRPAWTQSGAHKKCAAFLCIVAVVLYVLVTGANIPSRRAGVMAVVFFLSVILGKEGELINSLALSAVVVLLLNPTAVSSFSFLTSYAAVGAIALWLLWKKGGRKEPGEGFKENGWLGRVRGFFVETAEISLLLAVATAPLIMSRFNELHGESVLANLTAVPIAMFAIPSVFLSFALGSVWGPLGSVFAWVSSLGFSGIEFIAGAVRRSSVLSFVGPSPVAWLVAFYYLVFLVWAFRLRYLAPAAAALLAAIIFFYWPVERKYSEVRFIDVGQGDATLIMLRDGANILVDGGERFKDYDLGELVVMPELRRLGIEKLDAVIATHGDMDHVGGLFTVMGSLKVSRYMDNGEPHKALAGLRRIADERGVPRFGLRAGMRIPVSDLAGLVVLHPSKRFVDEHPRAKNNNVSLMLMLEIGGKRVLLPADNEKEAERHLVEAGAPLKADVLHVAHHGSGSSTTPAFLSAVAPRLAVISVGALNRYNMPAKKTIEALRGRGLLVLQTQYDGDVSLLFGDGGTSLKTYANPEPVLLAE